MTFCIHERLALKIQILASNIFNEHHYFRYHFRELAENLVESEFAKRFLDHLQGIDLKVAGFAEKFITNFASISGKPKHEPHYEQLVQMLAELVVIGKLATIYNGTEYLFNWEPTAGKNKKNPEISIVCEEWTVLIEVKCPSFLKHNRAAAKNSIQLGARVPGGVEFFNGMSNTGTATLPLDNKVKDYLISADEKFVGFKKENPKVHSLLVLVWTLHRYEAVSPLMNGFYGLFTENSFHKNAAGLAEEFSNVDGVLITSHYDMLLNASREELLPAGYRYPLDFGDAANLNYSHPVYIRNPHSTNQDARFLLDSLGAEDYVEGGDPFTAPMDMIFWLGR